jgi:6-pyruvoyltetrahydropterin/6-carboxytetrahydropterin synthase
MSTIRVTKEFNFEMAHALLGYDGPCKDIHGHSYKLSVTISGNPVNDKKSSVLGMVIDFSILKDIVRKCVIEHFDHALVLNNESSKYLTVNFASIPGKLFLVDYQPTCENLLLDFVNRIEKNLPSYASLHHLKLRETATSYAEWFLKDN